MDVNTLCTGGSVAGEEQASEVRQQEDGGDEGTNAGGIYMYIHVIRTYDMIALLVMQLSPSNLDTLETCRLYQAGLNIYTIKEYFSLQLGELRSSERTLQSRVKNITNELSVLKRG